MAAKSEMDPETRHELNNLLVVILGYAEILEHDLGAGHPLVAKVGILRNATQQAIAVVRRGNDEPVL